MMEVVEQAYNDCACYDEQARYPFDAAKLVEGRTEVTVARGVVIAMTAHSFAKDSDIFMFTPRM